MNVSSGSPGLIFLISSKLLFQRACMPLLELSLLPLFQASWTLDHEPERDSNGGGDGDTEWDCAEQVLGRASFILLTYWLLLDLDDASGGGDHFRNTSTSLSSPFTFNCSRAWHASMKLSMLSCRSSLLIPHFVKSMSTFSL